MLSHRTRERIDRILPLLEFLPLMAFVAVRNFDFDMPHRIWTGGALTILVLAALRGLRVAYTPLFFGTNLFFIFASVILLSPFQNLKTFFLDLGEVGMFLIILIVGLIWLLTHVSGLFAATLQTPVSKKYSWYLLLVYSLCPLIAWHFKGNENLAGALPFIIITVADKVLYNFHLRETKRKLQYVK